METNPEILCSLTACQGYDEQGWAKPNPVATAETACGRPVCDECHLWVMGRITCPFHGDDNCAHSWGDEPFTYEVGIMTAATEVM